MANPSNPENVARARDRIEANLADSSEEAQGVRRAAELFRLRRNQVLLVAAKMYREQLSEKLNDIFEVVDTGLTGALEGGTETLFSLTQLRDVYGRAKQAIEDGHIEDYVESVRRQLHHATINVRIGNGLVSTLMRVHYINARKKFLDDCEPENVDRLTGMEAG